MVCFSYIASDQCKGVAETASWASPTIPGDTTRQTEGNSYQPPFESVHRSTDGKQRFQQNNITAPLHFSGISQTYPNNSNQFMENLQNFTNNQQSFADGSNIFMNNSPKFTDNLQNLTDLNFEDCSQNFANEFPKLSNLSTNFPNSSPNISARSHNLDKTDNAPYTDMNILPDHIDSSVFDNICFDAGYDSDERHQGLAPDPLRATEEEGLEESPIVRMLEGGCDVTTDRVIEAFPFMTRDSLFEVVLTKSSRGLGLSVGGGLERPGPLCGLVRISRLHPQLPAALSDRLMLGDVLLEANRTCLAGLSCHEALEVIRTSKESSVRLLLCRPPDSSIIPMVESQRELLAYKRLSNNVRDASAKDHLASPVHSLYGEIELTLTKVNKSLGFSLCKRDNSVLGHTIRALVRPPALTDGRIKAGDKVLSVNGHDMCGLSHEEAIAFLRTTGESVVIRLYRDFSMTPVSPHSPPESYEQLLRAPKPLRQEARDMLRELAIRKKSSLGMTLGSDGSGGSTGRRRRRQKTPEPTIVDQKTVVLDRFESLVRRMDEDCANSRNITEIFNSSESEFTEKKSFNGSVSSSDQSTLVSRNSSDASSISDNKSLSNSPYDGGIQRTRPNFLDLDTPQSCARKCEFTPPHEAASLSPFEQYFSESEDHKHFLSMGSVDSEPCDNAYRDSDFTRIQPSYQSMNFVPSSPSEGNKISNTASSDDVMKFSMPQKDLFSSDNTKKGLLKWKGSVLPPEKELSHMNTSQNANFSSKTLELVESVICLHRGWNTRLGFSVKEAIGMKESNNEARSRSKTRVVAIYSGCAAAKDGRLKIGDFLIKVNEEDVSQWETDAVIDLLRKCQGRIELTVLQTSF